MVLRASHTPYSIASVQQAISNGKTVRAIVEEHLKAIEELDSKINSITALNPQALQDAEQLDRLDSSKRGPLFGVPIVIKDQIETAGIPTAFGSIRCKDYIPATDATLITKLKEAGAVIIAKSVMPDWATSWWSTSSLSGTTKNPYDLSREPGGSSSGSAAAVASAMAVAGIGGDTGGSIRLPSNFCGLVGVRVTPGRISRDGMSALVTTQDTPGPMTTSVEDAAKILDVIAGFDEKDEFTSINAIKPLGSFQTAIQGPSIKGKRLGVLRQAFGTHKGVTKVIGSALDRFAQAGAELIDVEIPDLEYYKSYTFIYPIRSKSDINGFLASRKELAHLKIEDLQAAGEYHKALDLIDRIAVGPADMTEAPDFAAKLLAQMKFQRLTAAIFAKHKLDAMIYPTSQLPAPKTQDILDMRWSCADYPTNTIIGSQLLWCAMSVPVGKTVDVEEDPDGPELPIGLEVLCLPLDEERMMAIGAGVEAAMK
ncbi:amidase family protein [Rhizodiscina lignyota]|uniref:Amidase family protein n=1 Tax=Rhizodiscina lignyota TaxID=1504668 RepID=A0A9P4IP22_9PEZI|nr:amidase family protein [Rhizodiscina lignyota]